MVVAVSGSRSIAQEPAQSEALAEIEKRLAAAQADLADELLFYEKVTKLEEVPEDFRIKLRIVADGSENENHLATIGEIKADTWELHGREIPVKAVYLSDTDFARSMVIGAEFDTSGCWMILLVRAKENGKLEDYLLIKILWFDPLNGPTSPEGKNYVVIP